MENPFEIILQRLDQIELLIKDLNDGKKEDNKILNVEEVAKFLNVTKSTIYGYINKKIIPFMKKGKKLYFCKNEIEHWVKEGRVNTVKDLNEMANNYIVGIKN